jgi:hypothetical protein
LTKWAFCFALTTSHIQPSFYIQGCLTCSFCHKMAGNSSFKIKWLEKPEYKCLSQIQNKFKAASCNVCIKDINWFHLIINPHWQSQTASLFFYVQSALLTKCDF